MAEFDSQGDAIQHLLGQGLVSKLDLINSKIWVLCPKCENIIKMYNGPICLKCRTDVENPPYGNPQVGDIVRDKKQRYWSQSLYRIYQIHGGLWGSQVEVDKEDYATTNYYADRQPTKLIALDQSELVKVDSLHVKIR